MRLYCKILLVLLAIGLSEWMPAEAGRVLVVHSYHKNHEWVREINKSLELAFKVHNIPFQYYYMDTKRRPAESWKISSAQKAKEAVAQYDPQVVIAVDDNAQSYFVKDYVNNSPIQFVFCGVNADPETYGYPAANVTGILERAHVGQTLHTLKAIMPHVRRVAIVSDDSTSANLILQRIQGAPTPSLPGQGIIMTHFVQPITFSQWKQTINVMEKDRQVDALLIPTYHTVKKDGASISVNPKQVLEWTIRHSTKPLVGFWPHFVNDGGLLSVTVDPHEHARVAAQMTLQILEGKRAGQIPVQVNQEGQVMINLIDKGHLVFDPELNLDQIADQVIR